MEIEEAEYKVVEKENRFEIRDYAPHILAETIVKGDLEEAGKKANIDEPEKMIDKNKIASKLFR